MPLQAGTRLGPFEVISLIGAGGMGEVWLATEVSLGRKVALKLLPPDLTRDPLRVQRFEQEARAASALNHPNVCTIHALAATPQGQHYIAMEYVDGETLRQRLATTRLSIRAALDIAIQVASALSAAHGAGIIHRDIKPENVMLRPDGLVKVVDFGLAKLIAPLEAAQGESTQMVFPTQSNVVLGTVAYMSPEQAEGGRLDNRTDIFSFGVLLYEMVTGRQPFTGETPMKTLSAILRDTPKPVSQAAPGCPHELERIIDRCLRKDAVRRWQHIEDVRVVLLELKEESDSAKLAPIVHPRAVKSWMRWWPIAGTVAAMGLAVIAWVLTRTTASPVDADLTPVPLTTYRGDERDPAFSPDGTQVAFSWGPEGGVTNTYVKLIGPGEPIRLTKSPYSERTPQWSPDGRWIAFGRRVSPHVDFVVMPALGGPERVIAQTPAQVCFWTPDSQWLLVADGAPGGLYAWPLHGGEKKLLVGPLDGRHGVRGGNISPDGTAAAVSIWRNGHLPLYIVPLGGGYQATGEPRPIVPTDWDIASFAWTPDSKGVVFIRQITGSNLGGITAMYRVPAAGGTPRRLDFAGDNPWFLDIARRGHRLAYTRLQRDVNVYAAELASDGTIKSTGAPIASSSRRDINAVFSPDGTRIVLSSDRDGSTELWIAEHDGTNPRQLTNVGRSDVIATDWPQWSPDSSQVVFTSRVPDGGSSDIFVISAAGGRARRVTNDPGTDTVPSWARDGKSILFVSDRGGVSRVWTVPAAGGPPRQLSPTTAAESAATLLGRRQAPLESPDGQWVYFLSGGALHRVSTTASTEHVVVKDGVSLFRPTSRGVFYLSLSTDLLSAELRVVPLSGGAPKVLGTIPHFVVSGPSFSPDFSRMLYARCDQCAADIMLVENFK